MNLKTKVVGFAASVAIVLTMTAGVMAAPRDVTVTAVASTSSCAASFSSGDYNLSVWARTGTAYELDSDSTSVGAGEVTVTPGQRGQ